MARRYFTLDVFTDRLLTGNPLAVVLDSEGLDTAAMQAIAREFNLSETVFVIPSSHTGNRAALRIFTPTFEMPFAGHPTVGTAVLLASLDHPGEDIDVLFGLEEKIGVVSCAVSLRMTGAAFARFAVPKLPYEAAVVGSPAMVARALGVTEADIGYANHTITRFGTGNPFTYVPVKNRSALSRIVPNASLWTDAFAGSSRGAAYVYCNDPEGVGHAFRARMFSPDPVIVEDPATGSAASALAGVIAHFDNLADGEHRFVIEQGFEMGRPSLIELTLTVSNGALASAHIGGEAVIVSQGTLHV
jgi:trans-2,3-dihydro-3-hydroxyanthranilate isomerase